MRKIMFCFVVLLITIVGCDNKNSITEKEENSAWLVSSCSMLEKSILDFFNVDSPDSLVLKRVTTEQKTDPLSIIMIASHKYSGKINDASRVVYLGESDFDYWPVLFMSRNPDKSNLKKLEIAGGVDKVPFMAVQYCLEDEFFDFYAHPNKEQSPFEWCLDECIGGKLQKIKDSNWIRQARFLVNAPVEFAWIVVDCSWDCVFNQS